MRSRHSLHRWMIRTSAVMTTKRSTTTRCYHNSSRVQLNSKQELHQQMKKVMGAKTAPPSEAEQQARRARVRQSAINVGISFMTVVLAGQALKSGSERRKMETKVYEATEEAETKIRLLKQLSSEVVVRELAQKVCREIPGNNPSWFRRTPDTSSTEERVYQVLLEELRVLIGDADQSVAERDRLQLEKLQQEEMAMAEQLLKEHYKNNTVVQVERVGDGETVIKKRVFRM
ncbi:hypothetical protein FisN_14Lh198 [Fistulifera solaris]|uniref:Uncharacterized protein n=1 Tax=Fistulifera solaris TaxID=1519565 RepID=A0A1Z5J9M1_FISSO|nr:hypothetical protein FisN_14Lh198 [Fistulifera solaris]|eukprot:GAX10685.1 hypothetical protein FisN_14Lh198 [Fistulifera solaris]